MYENKKTYVFFSIADQALFTGFCWCWSCKTRVGYSPLFRLNETPPKPIPKGTVHPQNPRNRREVNHQQKWTWKTSDPTTKKQMRATWSRIQIQIRPISGKYRGIFFRKEKNQPVKSDVFFDLQHLKLGCICVYIYINIFMYTWIYIYMCIHIYIYIYTHMNWIPRISICSMAANQNRSDIYPC